MVDRKAEIEALLTAPVEGAALMIPHLRAAIRDLLADVAEWRPIAGLAPCAPSLSPPHYVLMFNGHHVGVGWRGEDDSDFGPQFWSETGEPIEPPPTHYRALPEPPAGRE